MKTHYLHGRKTYEGGATYPVRYTYDVFGNKTTMMTYRDESLGRDSGDVTTWLYDEASNCMTNKVYADGLGPKYEYDANGRITKRTWARGVETFYTYDGWGNLTNTTYSDNTPTVSFMYDCSGNIVSAVTEGVATNLYAYSAEGLLTNEVQNGATLARSYDSLGRPTGYILCASATPRETTVTCSYDSLGRLSSVASGTNVFIYSHLPGTDLVSGYTCGGFSRTVTYEPYRDLVSAITNRFGSRVISTFEYASDAAGRRTAIKRSGEAMGPLSGATDAYGYNGRNEVVSARRTLGGSPVAGFDEDFAYDPIGNRISATDYDETGTARTSLYAANNINQYTSRTVPGWASVRGLADADATVAVNGNLAYMVGRAAPSAPNLDDLAYFFGSDDFDNSAGGGFAELEVSATVSNGTNDFVSVVTNRVFVPPANETYAYDADGNQTLVTTGTGAWQVEYNGENRPVKWTRVSPDSSTPNSSTPTLVSMTFDHQGRRRLYVEVAAGVTNKLHRFTYDDYVCVARNREIDAQHGVGSDAFVWDPTEPIATKPLMCNPSTETPFLYCHDGNKNVSETVSLYGTIAAHYEYSSFGKVVLVTSENEDQSTANLNPYRFSSEYGDDALGLVYYNYRHNNPIEGRWVSRDRIEGLITGINSICFILNRPINYSDWIGLLDISITLDLEEAIRTFDDWYNNEKKNLENRDRNGMNWVDRLPECPKELDKIGDNFVSPNSKEWKMSGKEGTSMLRHFHPGGAFELRTADSSKYGGAGNQCVYDSCGKLMMDLPSSGTVDFVSPTGDIGSIIGHFAADVAPFILARIIDNKIGDGSMKYVRRYYEVRPSK